MLTTCSLKTFNCMFSFRDSKSAVKSMTQLNVTLWQDIVEGRKTRVVYCLHVFIASNFSIVQSGHDL